MSAIFGASNVIYDVNKNLSYLFTLLYINPLKTKRRPLYLKPQFVPRSKQFISVIKTNHFMLYGAEVAVCSEIMQNTST